MNEEEIVDLLVGAVVLQVEYKRGNFFDGASLTLTTDKGKFVVYSTDYLHSLGNALSLEYEELVNVLGSSSTATG